ncbi:MAG: DNA gyrase subunit A [Deltaproteobacteria bacterium RIFCSPHIGHO2_12_FULL_43_9]|nr:MAG: DNA gyrase subunit A [Deltaproteobacteria bacterium RIFCSPHIGHO2_12_FULL_43_9]
MADETTEKISQTQNPIQPVNIEEEMKTSYLDYAMSVIVGRALPDARDGLKPVHRRILYAMYDLGNSYNKPYKKSARIVGDVIGKYHPHGDMAVYQTIVRMAQDFSMRYTLIDGQGNFGSIDGDAAAAMRYTEIRTEKITDLMIADIEKNTVDMVDNYDGSLQEPTVLPTRIPNLLANGGTGIAVGMATNIPPYNLSELLDAAIACIKDPNISLDEVCKIIKGPDFPTGGFIYGREGALSALKTGRGQVIMRAKASIETHPKGDRDQIVITELPYQVNKAVLITRIATLVRDKELEGISDIRDESDKDGIRIVLELKRGEIPGITLNRLYKMTSLQESFGVIMLALDNNQPRLMNIKQALQAFIDHRKEVVIRRSYFELKKCEARLHLLDGLKIAIENLDAVISLIKTAENPDKAKDQLVNRFKLSGIQAQAILDMRLQRLTGLEREKIVEEHKEVTKEIKRLNELLESEEKIYTLISEELIAVKNEFGDNRKTEIIPVGEEISLEDMIAEENVVVTVSHSGYIKRNSPDLYKSQHRGGKGIRGMETRDEDFVSKLFMASTHSYILCFTDAGKVYWLKVHRIPEAGRTAKGKAIVNILNMSTAEHIRAILPVKEFKENAYVVFVTKKGYVKKTELSAFDNPRPSGIIALAIDEGDSLVDATLTEGDQGVFIATKLGQSIRFKEEDVRPMGRNARGVRGINLADEDEVQGMEIITKNPKGTILTVTEKGYGKRTSISDYRTQGRGGSGIITIKITEKNGPVVGTKQIELGDELMIITDQGQIIRMSADEVSEIGRNTQGVRLLKLNKDEKVAAVAKLIKEDDEIEGQTPTT